LPKNFIKKLNGIGSDEPISEERVPTVEEIAKIMEYMPIQGKTLTILLASSGMRIGESLKLELDDIDLMRNPARIKLRAEYTKTKRKRITFTTKEGANTLGEWLEYRPEYIARKHIKVKETDNNNLFPFTDQNYRAIWKTAVVKAGLFKIDRKTKRMTMRPHNLRKFFRTYGRWTNPDIAECLMGHKRGLSSIYAIYKGEAEKILEEEYLKIEENLTILPHSRGMLKRVKREEKEISAVREITLDIQLENRRLKKQNEDFGVKILEMAVDIEELKEEAIWNYNKYIEEFIKRIPEIRKSLVPIPGALTVEEALGLKKKKEK